MLHPLKTILGYSVQATDKAAGKVADILFDDVTWNVRHVVIADAGGVGIQPASIDPSSVGGVDAGANRIDVDMTQEAIAGGPDVSTDPPVSRSHTDTSDPRLRSVDEVVGYKVMASDGDVGTVADLIVGEGDWKVHLVAVDRTASQGGAVLVGAGLVDRFDHGTKTVHVELDKARFDKSPAWDPAQPIARLEDVKLVGQDSV